MRLAKVRFVIVKIDALKRLLDVKRPRLSRIAEAIPIVHPVRRVGILLNFQKDISSPYGVNSSRGQKHGFVRFGLERVNAVGDFF